MNTTTTTTNNSAVTGSDIAVYPVRALASLPTDFKVSAGMRECRIIQKGKADGKVSMFCQLPEVTDAFVQVFCLNPKGVDLVRGYIETLQNAAVRKVITENGRSPTAIDLEMENLFVVGALTSETVRVTKETIAEWFASKRNAIAQFLAVQLFGADRVAAEGNDFWNSPDGEKAQKFASNYLPHFVDLAGRTPSYLPAVKQKLELVAAAVMDGTTLEEKMLEKLIAAVEKTADDLGI